MNIALGIEYDGRCAHGWQNQQEGIVTLQGQLETALSLVAAEKINVFCAGRTDTGVHATGQVVNFHTNTLRELKAWTFGVNSYLPPSMRVCWAQSVHEDFHARFKARARRYVYVIYEDKIRPALYRGLVSWCCQTLDAEKMHLAAQYLLGEQDFSSFRATSCQAKQPFRCIEFIEVKRQGALISIDIKANAFLHHMVRNIAGVLMEVGAGVKEPIWVQEVLAAKDRRAAAKTAPPDGLYFVDVDYPPEFGLLNKVVKPFGLE